RVGQYRRLAGSDRRKAACRQIELIDLVLKEGSGIQLRSIGREAGAIVMGSAVKLPGIADNTGIRIEIIAFQSTCARPGIAGALHIEAGDQLSAVGTCFKGSLIVVTLV